MPKPLKPFAKSVTVLFLLSVPILVLGRNHFILGTLLLGGRWILTLVGALLAWIVFRRSASPILKWGIVAAVALLVGEHVWNAARAQKLENGSAQTVISVMTYNLYFKNITQASSVANIAKFDPDILVVQELTEPMARALENAVGSRYRFKRTLALRGTHGIGIYSKHRIVSDSLLGGERRPFAQVVTLNIAGKTVQLINAHLSSPAVAVENPKHFISLFHANYERRSAQCDELNVVANKLRASCSAQLILGDLNTTVFEPLYRDLCNDWVDLSSHTRIDKRFTFPNAAGMRPLLTLDYIFGRGQIDVMETNVIAGGGSDHLALTGKIKL